MKKSLTIIFLIFSALFILDSLNFGHALMMFLLAGVIPGTNIALDGDLMLTLIACIIGFTVGRVMTNLVRSIASTGARASTQPQEA